MMAAAGARRFAIPVTRVAPAWRLVATAIVASAITLAAQRYSVTTGEARWLVVARNSAVTIAIDTSRIEHDFGHTFRIWYRTDHAVTRYYEGKAFNRETVQTVLRCDGYSFRVVSSEMSVRGGRAVMRQVASNGELSRQPWRAVETGSAEEDVATAACALAVNGRRTA